MRIGTMSVEILIPESTSLKSKRTVMKSLKDRIKKNFNVSIGEVGELDKWQRGSLAVAAIGSDAGYINGVLDRVLDFIRQERRLEVIDFEMELL